MREKTAIQCKGGEGGQTVRGAIGICPDGGKGESEGEKKACECKKEEVKCADKNASECSRDKKCPSGNSCTNGLCGSAEDKQKEQSEKEYQEAGEVGGGSTQTANDHSQLH